MGWNVRADDGSFKADATMTMTKTNERCPTPAPTNVPSNGATPAPVMVPIEEDDCACDDALDAPYCCDEMDYASECEAGCAGYNVTASCVREECVEDPVGSSGALRLTLSAVMAMVMGAALFV